MWNFRNIDGQHRARPRTLCGALRLAVVLSISVSSVMARAQQHVLGDGASRVDEKGRKYVNKIPYDVFFDKPLEVAKDNHIEGTSIEKSTKPAVEKLVDSDQSAVAPLIPNSPSTGWGELLPMEELQNEVKTIRSNLTKSLSNQGKYNQSFKQIAIDGAELAALAMIVQQHDDSISWKEKSQYVREFGHQISDAAKGLGKENFEKTKAAFERLSTSLDGSVPADAGEVSSNAVISEVISRKGLMKRIESAKDQLKQNVNTEAKFKSMSEQIRHETAILSSLTSILTSDGIEYAENSDYQGFAKSLISGAKDASESTTEESYDKFKQAIDKINKSCTDCHAAYGNGNG